MLVKHAVQKGLSVQAYKVKKLFCEKNILSKYQYHYQSDFGNPKGMPEKGRQKTQQFPDHTQRFSYPLNLSTHLHPYFLPNGMWS